MELPGAGGVPAALQPTRALLGEPAAKEQPRGLGIKVTLLDEAVADPGCTSGTTKQCWTKL